MADAIRSEAALVPTRRGYLDWMRGIAVLIMIEAHVLDSWTTVAERQTPLFRGGLFLGGFGAPLFLLLAGVGVSMSAGSKLRRSGDLRAAAAAVGRRGLEIFALAFVFRVQSWILGLAPAWTLLRVDILNIMGPAIAAAAVTWGACSSAGGRVAAFAAGTLAFALLAPIARAATSLAALPDALEAYLRPVEGLTNFMFFPWTGFVFAGAILGVLLDGARSGDRERSLNVAFALGGGALAAAAYAASFLPSPYAQSEFWTTSPAFFFLRLGLLTAAIAAAYAWGRRRGGQHRWSPVEQLGRTSFFIYWIHVEMVYGLISRPWHHRLTLPQVSAALGAFLVLMLCCSIWRDRVAAWWKARHRAIKGSNPAAVP